MVLAIVALIAFGAGALAGFAWARALKSSDSRAAAQIAKDLAESLKADFGSISLDALAKATDQLQKLNKAQTESTGALLQSKKEQIETETGRMAAELQKVTKLVSDLEKDRVEKFSQLTTQLQNTNDQTAALSKTAGALAEALASSKTRGQWGERMAEDVLRLAGFVERINYLKQKAIEGVGSKPDFTFLLPKDLKLNMDVKFPYDNYVRCLNAATPAERDKFRSDFLKDVKLKIKEVTTRDYINPEQNTVDYVILFVPNDQIYAFIHENDPDLLDTGIRNRVVFCSPVTLFAVLSIIRQAVDNFSLEKTSTEILSLLGQFKKQWGNFTEKMGAVGQRIKDAQKEYDALVTTRATALERPLNKIDALREQRGIAASDEEKSQPSAGGRIEPRPQIERALSEIDEADDEKLV